MTMIKYIKKVYAQNIYVINTIINCHTIINTKKDFKLYILYCLLLFVSTFRLMCSIPNIKSLAKARLIQFQKSKVFFLSRRILIACLFGIINSLHLEVFFIFPKGSFELLKAEYPIIGSNSLNLMSP